MNLCSLRHALALTAAAAAPVMATALSAQETRLAAALDASGATHAPAAPSYAVHPATRAMRVDAVLDEPAWSAASVIPLPLEISPADNAGAVVRTDCRITFDDESLYLGCVAYDPDPSAIRAFLTDRDRIFGNNDRISFLIDPFNDMRRGWVFEVSPLGVQADLVYDERTDDFDESWDAIWSSAGRITKEGYVIEAAIPFRSLRFPAGSDVQTWRFWINRMMPRTQYRIMRTNTRLRGEACQLCQAPVITGIRGISPGHNIELTPTVVGSRSDLSAAGPGAGLARGAVDWEGGLDARWGITTDLALNATVNPNFSQVEADAPQLDANTRFALSFPEKRPFFLEGADLFATPFRAVFTRTIADPVAGTKLTGKLGRNGLGVLLAHDELNNLVFPGPESSTSTTLGDGVTTALGRYRRDLGGRHVAGALYTARIGANGYSNHVAGADAFFQPTSEITAHLQVLGSTTRYPTEAAAAHAQPEGSFSGFAYATRAAYNARSWGLTARADLVDDRFRADAGFMTRVGYRELDLQGRRTFWGSDHDLFNEISIRGGGWSNRTTGGRLLDDGVWFDVSYSGPLQAEAWFNPAWSREQFGDATFGLLNTYIGLSLRPTGTVRVGISGNGGDAIDFRNRRQVDEMRLSPSLDLQVGRSAELGLSHHWQRLSFRGEDVLVAQVGQLRTIYNFSARAFLRGIFQYRRTDRNPATNQDLETPLSEGLFTSMLFSYKMNPLTVLFLGYTDERAGFEDASANRVHLAPTGRTFFLKVGYAWRP